MPKYLCAVYIMKRTVERLSFPSAGGHLGLLSSREESGSIWVPTFATSPFEPEGYGATSGIPRPISRSLAVLPKSYRPSLVSTTRLIASFEHWPTAFGLDY